MSTILLDADILAFKYAVTSQDTYDWDDFEYTSANVDKALCYTQRFIEALQVTLKADGVIVCLTCRETNWRLQHYPLYKSNRDDSTRPVLLQEVKDWLAKEYESMLRPGLEADDIMGILATHPHLVKGRKIMVSQDKDMKTVPGLLFDPDKDQKPRKITDEEALRFHLFQTLTGDTVDGYPGCPGVGPVAANEILDRPRRWDSYRHTFTRGRRAGESERRWERGEPCAVWEAIVSNYEKKGRPLDLRDCNMTPASRKSGKTHRFHGG